MGLKKTAGIMHVSIVRSARTMMLKPCDVENVSDSLGRCLLFPSRIQRMLFFRRFLG